MWMDGQTGPTHYAFFYAHSTQNAHNFDKPLVSKIIIHPSYDG